MKTILFMTFLLLRTQALAHKSVWLPIIKDSYLELVKKQPNQSAPAIKSQIETFWISPQIESDTEEAELSLLTEELRFTLSMFPNAQWLRVKIPDGFSYDLYFVKPNPENSKLNSIKLNPMNDSHRWQYKPKLKLPKVELINHSHLDNLIEIQYSQNIIEKVVLKPYESISVLTKNLKSVQSTYRTTWMAESAWEFVDQPIQQSNTILFSNGAAKFLLTNSSKNSSYIVEIDDPELIDQARRQIQFPNKAMNRILIGELDYNEQLINRDVYHPSKSPWSWKVSKVVAFSFFGQQSCDGNPEYLDEFFMLWYKQKRSICFWDFQITKELK